MESTDHIVTAQHVVGKFAQKHGLSGFAVNADGEAVLDFEGTEVFLYVDTELPALHLTAPIRTVTGDESDFESMLESALELNMFPEKLHDARFAYVRDMQTFVLCKRIDLRELLNEELDEPISSFLETLEASVSMFALKEAMPAGRA